jgi:Protein of unknown function (DUF3606)
MKTQTTETKPMEAAQVSLDSAEDVRYWTIHFRCNEALLREAVNLVGHDPEVVERYVCPRR